MLAHVEEEVQRGRISAKQIKNSLPAKRKIVDALIRRLQDIEAAAFVNEGEEEEHDTENEAKNQAENEIDEKMSLSDVGVLTPLTESSTMNGNGNGHGLEREEQVDNNTLRSRRPLPPTETGTAVARTSGTSHPNITSTSSPLPSITPTPFAPPARPVVETTASAIPTEASLVTERSEQEDMTASLVQLAGQLKSSTTAFHQLLEADKSVLERAVEGLDRNVAGLDATGRRMGRLTQMAEGRGMWGRAIMYIWIFALWVVVLLVVFVMPKLRF